MENHGKIGRIRGKRRKTLKKRGESGENIEKHGKTGNLFLKEINGFMLNVTD